MVVVLSWVLLNAKFLIKPYVLRARIMLVVLFIIRAREGR